MHTFTAISHDTCYAWLILMRIRLVEINLAIIAACMSTLPGVLAQAKKYGSSVYRSLRSFLVTSRGGGTSNASMKRDTQTTGDTKEGFTTPGSRKTLENTNYIQLEDGVKGHTITGDLHSVDNLPFWGKPWETRETVRILLEMKKVLSFWDARLCVVCWRDIISWCILVIRLSTHLLFVKSHRSIALTYSNLNLQLVLTTLGALTTTSLGRIVFIIYQYRSHINNLHKQN